jgi:hypothetical protein
MDGPRFDALTKSLVAAKPSRREALRRLAGGAVAAVFGVHALEGASAQDVGTEAFNLTCRGTNPPNIYCQGGNPGDCGRPGSGCVCGKEKRTGDAVCVEQPQGGCPAPRNSCQRSSDCGQGEACIKLKGCCGNNNRGKCVNKCPA